MFCISSKNKGIFILIGLIWGLSIYGLLSFPNDDFVSIVESIFNTLYLSIIIVLISNIIGFFLSYVLYFYDIRFKKLIMLLLIFPFVIPSYILSMLYLEYSDWLISDFGYIFIMTLASIPYSVLFIYSAFSNIKHKDILALKRFNVKDSEVLRKIIFSYVKKSLFLSSILIFAYSFTEFGTAVFTGANVLISRIYELWFVAYNANFAIYLVFSFYIFFLVLIYIVLKNNKNKEIDFSTITKHKKEVYFHKGVYDNKIIKRIFYFVLFIVVVFQTIIPIFVLGKWTMLSYNFFKTTDLLSSMNNTFYIVISAVVFMIITSFIYVVFTKRNNVYVNSFLYSNFFISGLFLGILGLFVIEKFSISIELSFFVLILILSLKFIPISISIIEDKYKFLSKRLIQIAKKFKLSDSFILRKITIPFLYNSIVFVFLALSLQVIKELPITLTLRPIAMDTLAIKAFYYSSAEMLYVSGIWILILITLIIIISLLMILVQKILKGG